MWRLVRIVVITLVVAVPIIVLTVRSAEREAARLQREMDELRAEMEAQVREREAMIARLSRSHRLAHVFVTKQTRTVDGAVATTSLDLIELDDDGGEVARQRFVIPGDTLFIDALTVHFDASAVAAGDPLRGRSIVLLRRVYSELLPPARGIPIDTPGAIPPGYAAGEPARFEQQIWSQFWLIASNPVLCASMGVHVAQGEAVYQIVREGDRLELSVGAAGGLVLRPMSADEMRSADAGAR